ncbi:peptidylprolyl isomerase [Cohnella massiliensis]|uniref:peptidylprolyl isomerase n=1 Tax=Cohnella massiliensis TaxID=1816691 RepID=UPI0009BAF8C0|nr:peptidylprolyl isomerase [Cohnella massiliensis]
MRRTKRQPYPPVVLLAIVFCILIGETGCMAGNSDSDTVATVGGIDITRQELLDELQEDAGAQTLRTMMLRIAVDKEAEEAGIEVSEADLDRELRRLAEGYGGLDLYYEAMSGQLGMDPEEVREDALYRLKLEEIAIRPIEVSDEEIRAYIADHADEFGPQVELQLSRIVTGEAEEAELVMRKLEEGENFADLARQFSSDEWTASEGGSLGWVSGTDPFVGADVLSEALRLDVGQIVGPIATEEGYQIVMVTGRKDKPAAEASLAEETARRHLALESAGPLPDLEQALLDKYGAVVRDEELKS